MTSRGRVLALAGVALACGVLIATTGCDRKPRFVPAGADSTAAVPSDSLPLLVESARSGWEAGDPPQETADLTARLILDDLRSHTYDIPANRVRTFLDSLGFGAEVVGAEIAAVNLFARSNPGAGSWPYLFWGRGDSAASQSIQGKGLRLLGLVDRRSSDDDGPPMAAVVFARTAGGGQQPLAYVWRRDRTRWALAQSLGPDSLGGTGTARVVEPPAGDVVLETRTWQPSPGFNECTTCPHVTRTRSFAWSDEGLRTANERVDGSAYHAFVQFVRALGVNDREMASRYVDDSSLIDAAQGYEWGVARGLWRVAPGTESDATQIVFFRGNQEAYRVSFTNRRGEWRIASFDPTSRSVE